MICLECTGDIHAILPNKIACVPSSSQLIYGPAKGGNLHPNLRLFCPEGYAYLPLTPGGNCVLCTNPRCSRCLREDLSKCLGCKTDTFLRKDSQHECISTPCPPNNYLTMADGNKCLEFILPGCAKNDVYGWCSQVAGEGCPVGQTYWGGVCCTENVMTRDYSTYPGNCIKCHDSCQTCSGTAANQCLSCPTYFGLRLGGSSCTACTAITISPWICLSCDADPNICSAQFNFQECGADKCLPGQCGGSWFGCNSGGCEQGYYFGSTHQKCYLCEGGCSICNSELLDSCSDCRVNF